MRKDAPPTLSHVREAARKWRAANKLPASLAASFLQRAVHDPDPWVRLAATEAAFELASHHEVAAQMKCSGGRSVRLERCAIV